MIDVILNKENYTGDLAKIFKGEEIAIPDGTTPEEYQAKLLQDRENERIEFYKTKLEPEYKSRLAEDIKKQYPSFVNPLIALVKAKGGFTPEEAKDKDIKELMEMYHERMTSKIEDTASKLDGDKESIAKQFQAKDDTIVGLNTKIVELEERYKLKEQESDTKYNEKLNEFKLNAKFSDFASEIQEKLAIKGEIAKQNITFFLEKHGYKVALKDDAIVILNENGSEAMNLTQTAKLTKEEDYKSLVYELAKIEGLYKYSLVEKKELDPENKGRVDIPSPKW